MSLGSSARMVVAGRERSMTCVAPREVSREALCGEAVVMMGANLASFAIWIASRAPNE